MLTLLSNKNARNCRLHEDFWVNNVKIFHSFFVQQNCVTESDKKNCALPFKRKVYTIGPKYRNVINCIQD